jgi:hypothetical protein
MSDSRVEFARLLKFLSKLRGRRPTPPTSHPARYAHDLVQACQYKPGTGCSFLRAYASQKLQALFCIMRYLILNWFTSCKSIHDGPATRYFLLSFIAIPDVTGRGVSWPRVDRYCWRSNICNAKSRTSSLPGGWSTAMSSLGNKEEHL